MSCLFCSGTWLLIPRFFFFQAEDGIRYLVRSRGLGDVYKRQVSEKRAEANGQVGFDFDSLWDEPQPVNRVPDRPELSLIHI